MELTDLHGTTALVTGAAGGFGAAITRSLVDAGAHVVGLVRDPADAEAQRQLWGASYEPVVGDAADAGLAHELLARHRPRTVVLTAGEFGPPLPVHEMTWTEFSRTWEVDVQQTFEWVGAALRLPLDPGSTVITFSSGAALGGSPLSGGYAGGKAAVRFITGYAAQESELAGLGIRFTSVLPKLTAATERGAGWVAAYAGRSGHDLAGFLEMLGPQTEPDDVAGDVVRLARDATLPAPAYLLSPGNPPAPCPTP